MVDLSHVEPGTHGTFPVLRIFAKSKAAGLILICPTVRMSPHPLKTARNYNQ